MPRIPDDEIDRLKRSVDLAALVRSRGVELAKHGSRDLIGRCPFHDDKEPSFIVTPEKGLFHCLGCGKAGNPIQFVQWFDGVSFRHAFELLNDGPAAFRAPPGGLTKQSTVPRLENPLAANDGDAALLGQVVDYYHGQLKKTAAALAYLDKRGLKNDEAIEKFRLGFADRTLCLRLPAKNRQDGEAIRSRLEKFGILRESGHELMTGSVTVPIFNEAGHLVEMYGRKITARLKPGTALHLYLPGPHEGVWNVEALNEPDVILCEAALDALTFWVNGIHNVTFSYGCQGFTDELFETIRAKKVRRVRIAYDADDAGNKAAIRDAERLAAQGIDVYRVKFPHGMDANEYALKVLPAHKSLETAVRCSEPMHTQAGLPRRSARAEAGAPSSSSLAADLAANKKSTFAGTTADKAASVPSLSAISAPSAVAPSSLERLGEYRFLSLGSREYRVGGLEKNNSLEVMKVAVRVRHGEAFHLDAFDLLRDGERRRFIERAAEETGLEKELIKRDMGKLLLALEQEQTERINASLKPESGNRKPELTEEEKKEALAFLKSPNLVEKIAETFDACGLVGEDANRLAAYLACTSRKLARPLAVIIQSTSAAGKSTLMEAVLAMFPEEERVKYSAMTGQSLYYLGEQDLKHKVLAIVEEEGAEKAGYALKLLQSEGELTIASTGKDPHTGRMETQEYHVEGPVMIFLTTTAVEIDEELLNRCLVLTVDESKEQTARIHTLQRQARTIEGLRLRKRRERLLALMRNVQRLLNPLDVVNPYADELTFTADRTRTRRDHEKYLTLIDSIALLHQHQRTTEKDDDAKPFIRVTLDDIALANKLAPELLGRSLDELPPQTRRLFETVKALVRERCEAEKIEQKLSLFSRRDVRARLGWSVTQIRVHLDRLQQLDLVAARFGRAGSSFQYELLTDCTEEANVERIGLLDVEKLRVRYQPDGVLDNLTGGWRTPARQGQPVEIPRLTVNLTACPVRTSGPLAGVTP